MARISPPFNQGVPGFNFNGLQIDVPVDLPEGGHLYVIVGDNPVGIPEPSIAIPKGAMVGIIPAQAAEQLRPVFAQMLADFERKRNAARNGQ